MGVNIFPRGHPRTSCRICYHGYIDWHQHGNVYGVFIIENQLQFYVRGNCFNQEYVMDFIELGLSTNILFGQAELIAAI